jgi:branched-chain amino acid transport system substrate-binding protein
VTAGIRGTSVATVPVSATSDFATEFAAFAPGSPMTFAPYAYDCAVSLALAAQATRSDDSALLRDEIINVTRGGVGCRTYTDCKRLLDLGRNIDYEGASGRSTSTTSATPAAHVRRVRLQPGRHRHDRAPDPGQPLTG